MDAAQRGRNEPVNRIPGVAAVPAVCFAPVQRPEIYARLDRVVRAPTQRILLVCAPAGSGKTVTLAEWVERRRGRARFAWVTVTEGINDPAAIWRTLGGALELEVSAQCRDDAASDALLPRTGFAGPNAAADELARALWHAPPTVLVLDDAHLLTDPLAAAGLEHFLLHSPPQLTTVIAARHEPPLAWHRLDTRGELVRLGAAELAMNREQAAVLCAQHGGAPSAAELDAVMSLTRGWAALVRLCGIRLHASDRGAAMAALARPAHAVSDFLVGEVLAALPDSTRQFLVCTSVPEEFTEELVAELAGPGTAAMLDGLERMCFPISSVQRNGQRWYRYHPMLRAQLLGEAHRSAAERLPEWHLRTAQWHRDAGSALVALRHLLAGPDREYLYEFLRERGLALAMTDEGAAALSLLDRDAADLSNDAFLWLLRALQAVTTGTAADAAVYLEMLNTPAGKRTSAIAPELVAPLTTAVTIDVAAATGVAARHDIGVVACSGLPDLVLRPDAPPDTDDGYLSAYLATQSATVMLSLGALGNGERLLLRALTFAEHAGHPYLALRAATRLAAAAGQAGSIGLLRERAHRAMRLTTTYRLELGPDAAHAIGMAAYGAYLQGEQDDSTPSSTPLLDRADQDGSTSPVAGWHGCVLARLLALEAATDRYAATEALRRSLLTLLLAQPERDPTEHVHWPIAAVAELVPAITWAVITTHGPGTARQLADRAMTTFGDVPEVRLAQAAVADAANKARSARSLLTPILIDAPELPPVTAVTAWLLHARALDRLGASAKIGASLENALRTAESERLVRPFLQVPGAIELLDSYAGQLGHGDRFAELIRHHPAVPRRREHTPLTEAELTVLKRLPAGHTAQQIADELGVSVNTVKTHLRGIYAKLDANSRVDALDRARRDGMV